MRGQKKIRRLLVGFMTGLLLFCGGVPIQVKAEIENIYSMYDDGLYPIMGTTACDIGQMINYYESKATYPSYYANSDAPTLYDFCRIYIEECAAEGVRAEVAFCQAMKETGFLQFGGRVDISQYNFAGIGATDSGATPNTFSSVREGVRGQVQHLKAYATIEPLNNPCVDPRYHLVTKGTAPYVEWLGINENPNGKGWATSPGYGYSIKNDYIAKLMNCSSYTTWYQGTNYAVVYNPTYYLQNNPDVAKVYGGNGDSVLVHFLVNGMQEGRQGNSSFNVYSYKNQYVDLRNAFGNDLKSYYLHYVSSGQNEGRAGTGCTTLQGAVTVYNGVDYSKIYNYTEYLNRYADLKAAFSGDDIAALEHFINCGMREGRQGSSSFDVNSYRNEYPDLRAAFGNDLKSYYLHYLNIGYREGRKTTGCTSLQGATTVYQGINYAPIYDYNYYLSVNADVNKVYGGDEYAVLEHFVNFGMKEGRQASSNFDVHSYKNEYPDLRAAFGNDSKSYYLHYINFGQKEKRQTIGCTELQGGITVLNGINYADVYDYTYYINHHADVKKVYGADDIAVLKHFVDCGMKEGRQAKESFNVQNYRNRYADLQAAYNSDLKSYYLHYIEFGKQEGRDAK